VSLDNRFFRGDAHVDVLAEDHLPLGDPTQSLHDDFVAFLIGDLLVFVGGEGVSAGGGERGTAGRGPRSYPASQPPEDLLGLGYRGTRGSLYLQDRLEEFVGDGLLQVLRQARHDLFYLRDELARGRVHYVELLFDSQGVGFATVELYRHDFSLASCSPGLRAHKRP
jgi:hypothetical protein